MALPVISLSGTPFEQGLQHGQRLKARIEHNLAVYYERFKTEVFLERPEVLRRANLYAAAIKEQSPDYYAAMQGVAEGAALSFEDIAALNVRYEILYYEFGVGDQRAGIDGCTSFAILPSRTANSHLMMGQSWDWIPQVKGAVLQTEEADGLKTLSFTEAGIVGGKIGLNSAGVGLCINGLASLMDDWTTLEKPFHVRCHDILRQRRFEDARAIILDHERPGSANFLIAQSPDNVINIESAPRVASVLEPQNGAVTHTNHFANPKSMGLAEIENEFWENSCKRRARMDEMLASKPTLGVDDLHTFLRDHANYPNSVCRHEDHAFGPEEHYISVTSVLMDLDDKVMWLSDGPPCENPFERLELS